MKYKLSIYLPLMLFVTLLLSVVCIKPIKTYAYSTDQEAIEAGKQIGQTYSYYMIFKGSYIYYLYATNDGPFIVNFDNVYNGVYVTIDKSSYTFTNYYASVGSGDYPEYAGGVDVYDENDHVGAGGGYESIIYANHDLYDSSGTKIYSYNAGGWDGIFISIAQSLNLEMEPTIDVEWYDQIYRQGYVVIINSDKEKLYSVLSSPEPIICKKVNRFILSDYYTMSGKIRHRFPRAGDVASDPATYNLVGQTDSDYYATTFNDVDEILYTSYDIYDANGNLIKEKNMDVPKWEPELQYKSDMLRLYDSDVNPKENTEDTFVLDWLYRELTSDLYYTEYEIKALSTVEEYHKHTQLRTYLDVLSDGGYSGNMMGKSRYIFDLSDVAEKIAVKSWLDESVTSVIPDAFYVRPIQMILYDNKVYYGDWLKTTFVWNGNKIVKVTFEDVTSSIDNGDGTITDIIASDSNTYEQTEFTEVKLAEDELEEKLNGSSSGAINSATSTLKNIPGLVGALFTFIPTEFIVLLGLALTFIIALMIKRAIL